MLTNKYTKEQITEAVDRMNGTRDASVWDYPNMYVDCMVPDCSICQKLEKEWILPYLKTQKSTIQMVMDQIERVRQQAHREGYDHGYDVGHDVGYEDWYDKGYEKGYETGYSVGYDAAADIYDRQYELRMVHFPEPPVMVCGHSDPFWLIHRAASLLKVLSDMTPNISFEIWDRDGNIECRLDGYTGKIEFRGEAYLGDAASSEE